MMYAVNVMDIPSSVSYFYPRLIPLHDLDTESSDIPLPLRCTADKLQEDGAYLLGEFRKKKPRWVKESEWNVS